MLVSLLQLVMDFLDLLVKTLQLAEQRLNAAGAQAALFKEHSDLATIMIKLLGHLRALGIRKGGVQEFKDLTVAIQQALNRWQVGRNARRQGFFVVLLSGGDAHGAVKRQRSSMNLLEDLHGHLRRVVTGKRHAPEAHARGFDLLCKANLFFAREKRNRSHLREVHADRVINPLRTLFSEGSFNGSLSLLLIKNFLIGVGDGSSGRLLGEVLLVFKSTIEVGRRTIVLIDHLHLRRLVRLLLIALELQVRLQRGIKHVPAVALALALINEFDTKFIQEDNHLVNLLRLDEFIGDAADVLLVRDPLAAAPEFNELAEDGG